MKPVTVPFFISHQGCPHTCVFCDQRTISGASGTLPTSRQLLDKIYLWQASAGSRPLEVAFFGGTFTALAKEIQSELLTPLQPLLRDGTLGSIRISTRPDAISADHLLWLSEHGIRVIELGVQSMDDNVLAASGRGHSAADTLRAIACIKKEGLSVGAQLMPGLPGDTPVSSLDSLEQVIAAGVDFLRIYPTVVFQGTELAQLFTSGSYVPLSMERGIILCKVLLWRALQAGIPVIRIGLQADHGLNAANILAGCWHPALGQMVRSQLYADLVDLVVEPGSSVKIHCHPARLSDLVGINRCNLQRQAERGVQVQIIQDVDIHRENIKVVVESDSAIYSIVKDNNYSIDEV